VPGPKYSEVNGKSPGDFTGPWIQSKLWSLKVWKSQLGLKLVLIVQKQNKNFARSTSSTHAVSYFAMT